jgi:hypothetical protein
VKKVQSNPASEGAISRNKLDVGDFVSTDQFVCRTPGRLPSGYGREGTNRRFMAGLFIMMPHLGSFGLRIKYLSAPVSLVPTMN